MQLLSAAVAVEASPVAGCAQCKALCCRSADVALYPAQFSEDADVVAAGKGEWTAEGWRIARQANGWCVYLQGDGRCAIYAQRPGACRAYTCEPIREAVALLGRARAQGEDLRDTHPLALALAHPGARKAVLKAFPDLAESRAPLDAPLPIPF